MLDAKVPSYSDAEEAVRRVKQAMQFGMRDDPRFRMLVDSCVAMARQEYGPVDPDYDDRAAYEHATFAAAMLLARVYDQDGELAALKRENALLRDNYFKLESLTPASFVVPTIA